jgi:hypothetical protein
MDFLLGFLVGGIVTFFYWRSVIVSAIGLAAQTFQENQQELDQTLNCNVEQHENTFLLYQADTNRFIVQGTCMQDFINYLDTVPETQIKIINGKSDAARALIKTGETLNEISNNQ